MRLVPVSLALLLSFGSLSVFAQQPLANTPPMGWNSWNHFADKVTDADVRTAADQMVANGMRDAGYTYVNVDDAWQGKRDASGTIHSNERFPDMKALADYVHSKGLKFGVYSSPGAKTCARYEGSLGHETQDARTYAAWGVDFLKYDLCSYQDQLDKIRAEAKTPAEGTAAVRLEVIATFRRMGDALKATGRPILYSLCQYGLADPWKWGPSVGAQMWRTTDDINDTYGRMLEIGQSQADLASFAGPGHWNDPDMLEVGNGKMTEHEYRTHMSLWVLLSAPLLAGNDLSRMSAADRNLLLNREAIAIDQDPLGKQATRFFQAGDFSGWIKPLKDGRVAVGLVNTSWQTRYISFNLADVGFAEGASLRDVWQGKELGKTQGVFTGRVPDHDTMLLVLTK